MEKITLYTQPDCPPCKIVKMFLQEYNISYHEKDIKNDSKARSELTGRYGSYSTPTTVIGDKVIIGFELEQLKEALQID
ncbi:glutaredoxin domain-containing protein [Bacillus sp. V5-8f]|uniref:glutaredoxin family protein n=1 Tax=Bacillus sp. V5-8f TaxID=2053044 RepID=UPI000C794EF8|nr:glutaredoxin domain-containing protein [Bacillus sp. V5-8f]PLT34377.1 NrdH-redoxin [Bacillus sp. V5-8f]